MNLGTIEEGMNRYEMCDALLLAPFSSPETFKRRVQVLRDQGRETEAVIVETALPDKFTLDAQADWERISDQIAAAIDTGRIGT